MRQNFHFKNPNIESIQTLTWSHAKAENVGEDAGHAQVRHPRYMLLFACGEESTIYTLSKKKRKQITQKSQI